MPFCESALSARPPSPEAEAGLVAARGRRSIQRCVMVTSTAIEVAVGEAMLRGLGFSTELPWR
jgi:hypothetical protein